METIKRLIRIFLGMLALPVIILHEMSHYIASICVGVIPRKIEIVFLRFRFPLRGFVYQHEKYENKIDNTFRFFIINIAPMLTLVNVGILAFFYSGYVCVLIYLLLFFQWSFLSDSDINRALNYLGFNKEVHFNQNTKFNRWLYYDNLPIDEYLKRSEELFLNAAKMA